MLLFRRGMHDEPSIPDSMQKQRTGKENENHPRFMLLLPPVNVTVNESDVVHCELTRTSNNGHMVRHRPSPLLRTVSDTADTVRNFLLGCSCGHTLPPVRVPFILVMKGCFLSTEMSVCILVAGGTDIVWQLLSSIHW